MANSRHRRDNQLMYRVCNQRAISPPSHLAGIALFIVTIGGDVSRKQAVGIGMHHITTLRVTSHRIDSIYLRGVISRWHSYAHLAASSSAYLRVTGA